MEIKTYKKINKGKEIEAKYVTILEDGTKVAVRKKMPYTVAQEKQLLEELKEVYQNKGEYYAALWQKNIEATRNLENYGTVTGLSAIIGTPFYFGVATCTGFATITYAYDFAKTSLQINRFQKAAYIMGNEEAFNKINESLGITKAKIGDKRIQKKLSKICASEEEITLNNVNTFSQKQLKKLNAFYHETLK